MSAPVYRVNGYPWPQTVAHLLAECRAQRRYMAADQKFGAGLLVASSIRPQSQLRRTQRLLAHIRTIRGAT